jgi:hypothetical protein
MKFCECRLLLEEKACESEVSFDLGTQTAGPAKNLELPLAVECAKVEVALVS